ncbi:uncharacterized protein LOC126908500 [Daktulosphaira vitifoliae]|uniref:uncharacterized protein LOC126908500 n=1 Tax=Daktulosphaira vitifoliae TaxID=58002 RepID=UPI0021AACC80|nr:uncharacterized protein LOC126908500 [Daktulosphaira vitifoliae]
MEAFRCAVERVMGKPKDQLDYDLMASVQEQLLEVMRALNEIRPLAELTDIEKHECAKISSVKYYPTKCIVHEKDSSMCSGDAYFLLSGRCLRIQKLHIKCFLSVGKYQYRLIKSDCKNCKDPKHRTVYVKTSELGPGSVFNIGEKSENGCLVVTISEVKFLLVPLNFLTKHNTANIWGRIVCSLNLSTLSVQQCFQKFVTSERWEEYKKSVVDSVVQKWQNYEDQSKLK